MFGEVVIVSFCFGGMAMLGGILGWTVGGSLSTKISCAGKAGLIFGTYGALLSVGPLLTFWIAEGIYKNKFS
jgi:hypothetical protein